MNSIKVSGKTFLCGEYIALKGGPSLILTDEPNFTCTFHKDISTLDSEALDSQNLLETLHPHSPAGKWLQKHKDFYSLYRAINFDDPYKGKGGFGASSAQFLSLYLYMKDQLKEPIDLDTLLESYREMAWNGRGLVPSGADVIAQFASSMNSMNNLSSKVMPKKASALKESLVFIDNRDGNLQSELFSWPFKDLGYMLLHTGQKLATHKHLESLTAEGLGDLSDLCEVATKMRVTLEKKQSENFLEGLAKYSDLLEKRKWVSQWTLDALQFIQKLHGVSGAKGCGAMGADVIFVCLDLKCFDQEGFDNKHLESITKSLIDKGLSIIKTNITGNGLQVSVFG